jgi:hypothetical protein
VLHCGGGALCGVVSVSLTAHGPLEHLSEEALEALDASRRRCDGAQRARRGGHRLGVSGGAHSGRGGSGLRPDSREDCRSHSGVDIPHRSRCSRSTSGGNELLGASVCGDSRSGRGLLLLLEQDVVQDCIPGRDAGAKVDAHAASARGARGSA